jgi:hypothetical protein
MSPEQFLIHRLFFVEKKNERHFNFKRNKTTESLCLFFNDQPDFSDNKNRKLTSLEKQKKKLIQSMSDERKHHFDYAKRTRKIPSSTRNVDVLFI